MQYLRRNWEGHKQSFLNSNHQMCLCGAGPDPYPSLKCTGPCGEKYHAGCVGLEDEEATSMRKDGRARTWACPFCRGDTTVTPLRTSNEAWARTLEGTAYHGGSDILHIVAQQDVEREATQEWYRAAHTMEECPACGCDTELGPRHVLLDRSRGMAGVGL